jgi:hypothetical protein
MVSTGTRFTTSLLALLLHCISIIFVGMNISWTNELIDGCVRLQVSRLLFQQERYQILECDACADQHVCVCVCVGMCVCVCVCVCV